MGQKVLYNSKSGVTLLIFGTCGVERESMDQAGKRKIITAIQVVLAVLVAVGLVWLIFKLVGYNQAQQVYHEIEQAYASQTSDDDPSSIDFTALQERAPNTVGWLKMDDVDLSYPVMQGEDNEYYLHYDPDGQPNIAGSIFMDYRNKSFKDLHVLLYGHNMLDDSMFGSLDSYLNEDFYRNGTDAFTVFTPEGKTYRYQIFAVNVVSPIDDVYQTGFQNSTVFGGFAKQLKANSLYDTGVDVGPGDHVVTLSTCSDNDRLVLSAKRIQV